MIKKAILYFLMQVGLDVLARPADLDAFEMTFNGPLRTNIDVDGHRSHDLLNAIQLLINVPKPAPAKERSGAPALRREDIERERSPYDAQIVTNEPKRQRYEAQIAMVEPLSAPAFIRTATFEAFEHGTSQEITVTYQVIPSELHSRSLEDEVIRLFQEFKWSKGTGDSTMSLAFAKEPFAPNPHGYAIHHAYLYIASDRNSIRCTYGFRSRLNIINLR